MTRITPRGKSPCRAVLGLAAVATQFFVALPSRAQSPPQAVPRVSLAEIKSTPGSSLMMPLSLTPDPKNPLRSLTVEIEFVSKSLTFDKTSKGLAAEMVNASIQSTLAESAPDDKGLKRVKLRITASLSEPAPKKGLPDGLLAYLLFQVSDDAQPLTVKLTPTVVSAEDLSSPPKKVAKVGADPGTVIVEALDDVYQRLAPALACFFFTH